MAFAILFYFATRQAYWDYFSGDDLDKTGWPTLISWGDFARQLVTPRFSPDLFRPVGYLYYRIMGRTFQLTYWPYVVVLQVGHVINVVLLFFVLRRLKFSDFAAAAGALFFSFHAAVIDIYWQPQYIFEVLACMLSFLAMLLYMRGSWLLAIIPFWFAYKSKEITVTLPLVLLAYELLLGERKWKRLIPYFVISLNFGLQAVWHNRHTSLASGYVLRFTPEILWHTVAFYASAIFFLPLAGLALLVLPFLLRDRVAWLGSIFMVALFVPMIVLPGRLESVYWYIPLVGVTLLFAVLFSRLPPFVTVLFLLIWLPLNYKMSYPHRAELFAIGSDTRWYTTGLVAYARTVPHLKAVVYEGTPWRLGSWGVEGAIHHAFGFDVDAVWYMNPKAGEVIHRVPMAIVAYDPFRHAVTGRLRTADLPETYIRFRDRNWVTESQLGDGWYDRDTPLRWIAPRAEARFYRPPAPVEFQIEATVPEDNLRKNGPSKVTLLEDGRPLGTAELSIDSRHPLRWKLPAGEPGVKLITILCEPVRHGGPQDPRDLGIAISALGYVTASDPSEK